MRDKTVWKKSMLLMVLIQVLGRWYRIRAFLVNAFLLYAFLVNVFLLYDFLMNYWLYAFLADAFLLFSAACFSAAWFSGKCFLGPELFMLYAFFLNDLLMHVFFLNDFLMHGSLLNDFLMHAFFVECFFAVCFSVACFFCCMFFCWIFFAECFSDTVFPHIRPRLLFSPHKSVPGVRIIKNEGIIWGRVLYVKIRYMFFLLYALCWMVFFWFLFCTAIKPILSTFRAENVQVEEAIGKIVSILSFMTQEYVRNTTFCKQTCVGR